MPFPCSKSGSHSHERFGAAALRASNVFWVDETASLHFDARTGESPCLPRISFCSSIKRCANSFAWRDDIGSPHTVDDLFCFDFWTRVNTIHDVLAEPF